MRQHEHREVTEDALRAVGIKGIFSMNGKHCKIEFVFAGRTHAVFFPNTTSDWRAVKNHRAFMRRKLAEIGAQAS